MSQAPPPGARTAPSTARNREPILAVLKTVLPVSGLVLEIAAGAGEHAVFNAAALSGLQWLPTDPDAPAVESIRASRDHAGQWQSQQFRQRNDRCIREQILQERLNRFR